MKDAFLYNSAKLSKADVWALKSSLPKEQCPGPSS